MYERSVGNAPSSPLNLPRSYQSTPPKERRAIQNINVVVITGNLTSDPELRSTPSGTDICKLRVAVNTRRKDQSGEWRDIPNFFDVTVFGGQGTSAARYLEKGRPVAIEGRLEWREWETTDGTKRQAVGIIANNVQFLGDGKRDGPVNSRTPRSDVPSEDFTPVGGARASSDDDDIPFVWDGPTEYNRAHSQR